MAYLNLDYYQGEEEYSDGDIEDELLSIVRSCENLDEFLKTETRWPVIYHLSNIRQNILNWYPFDPHADVLEIGAGCGAVTGLLCREAGSVTALELTKRRARINYERNKEYQNLEVVVGDLFKVELGKKFNYITVIGVLEYASLMSHDRNPYKLFLDKVKSMLKPGGHILIAIENRLGLKYFAGAGEDHTGRFFDGINGYPEPSNARTFSKKELEELLDLSGLGQRRFYYPFPDYKFVKTVCSDETVGGFADWLNLDALDRTRLKLFNERKAMLDFAKEGVLDAFSNSFLVDAGPSAQKILLARLNSERNPEYRIATVISEENGKKAVHKKPLSDEAKPHIAGMVEAYRKYGSLHGFELAPAVLQDNGTAVFEYIEGETFSSVLRKLYEGGDRRQLLEKVDWFYHQLFDASQLSDQYPSGRFVEFFGDARACHPLHCVSPCNLDQNFENLIVGDSGESDSRVIDYEWILDFPVPAEFIFWRCIFNSEFMRNERELASDLLKKYHIDEEDSRVFEQWEMSFVHRKVIGFELYDKAKQSVNLNLNELNLNKYNFVSELWFDYGDGFKAENRVRVENVHLSTPASIQMKVKEGAVLKALRFVPASGFPCLCELISVTGNPMPSALIAENSVLRDGRSDLFLDSAPAYRINSDVEKVRELSITYRVEDLDGNQAIRLLRLYQERLSQLQQAYDAVVHSRSWKITKPLRKISGHGG